MAELSDKTKENIVLTSRLKSLVSSEDFHWSLIQNREDRTFIKTQREKQNKKGDRHDESSS